MQDHQALRGKNDIRRQGREQELVDDFSHSSSDQFGATGNAMEPVMLKSVTRRQDQTMMLLSRIAAGSIAACLMLPCELAGPQAAAARTGCESAIAEVRNDIENRLGAVVTEIQQVNVSEWRGDSSEMQTFDSPFNNADQIVVVRLGSDMGRGSITRRQGQAAENIMNSPQLTRDYANQIIRACDPVASVKFFYWEWFQGWSLHTGNVLRQDTCKNPDGSNYYWGENVCL